MFHNREQKSHKNWFHVDDIKSRCDKQDGVNTGVFRRSHPRNCKAHYGVCLPCSNELAWFTKTEPRPSHWDGSAHSCLGNKINYYQMRNWAIRSVSLESGTCLPPHNLQEMRRASAGTTKNGAQTQSAIKAPRGMGSHYVWNQITFINLPSWLKASLPTGSFSALAEEDEWQTERGAACWYPCGVLIQHPLPKFSNAFILMETISAASATYVLMLHSETRGSKTISHRMR